MVKQNASALLSDDELTKRVESWPGFAIVGLRRKTQMFAREPRQTGEWSHTGGPVPLIISTTPSSRIIARQDVVCGLKDESESSIRGDRTKLSANGPPHR